VKSRNLVSEGGHRTEKGKMGKKKLRMINKIRKNWEFI